MKMKLHSLTFPTLILACGMQYSGVGAVTLKSKLKYRVFPTRKDDEAAVVEWGNSAIISALDAVVASFGPQTSLGAFFEVETTPVLASPIDGRGGKKNIQPEDDPIVGVPYPGPLDNKDEIEGNMLVMTNEGKTLSGVAMARIAKESGAAALMVVNIDHVYQENVYSLTADTEDEKKYAEEHIDIPIIMVSLASGNHITSANIDDNTPEDELGNHAMPERIRLYSADDRPYFEDAISENPILYIVHNLITSKECEALIQMAKNNFKKVDDTSSNLLENTVAEKDRKPRAVNVEKAMLWKGKLSSHTIKQIDERISQVTGYSQEQLGDWQISKFEQGSHHNLHYDHHPIHPPIATITIFLNDLEGPDAGGELVFPKAGGDKDPIMVRPKKAMAILHNTLTYEGSFDYSSLYGEKPLTAKDGQVKYIARKFIYEEPLPPSKRIVLPILALLNGGKLPRWVITLHDYLLVKFGLESGAAYFDKFCIMGPVLLFLGLSSLIGFILNRDDSSSKSKKEVEKTKKKD